MMSFADCDRDVMFGITVLSTCVGTCLVTNVLFGIQLERLSENPFFRRIAAIENGILWRSVSPHVSSLGLISMVCAHWEIVSSCASISAFVFASSSLNSSDCVILSISFFELFKKAPSMAIMSDGVSAMENRLWKVLEGHHEWYVPFSTVRYPFSSRSLSLICCP